MPKTLEIESIKGTVHIPTSDDGQGDTFARYIFDFDAQSGQVRFGPAEGERVAKPEEIAGALKSVLEEQMIS